MAFFLLNFCLIRYRCLKSGNREIDFPFRLNYTFSPIKSQQPAGNFIGLMGKRLLKLCKPTNEIGIDYQKWKNRPAGTGLLCRGNLRVNGGIKTAGQGAAGHKTRPSVEIYRGVAR